MNRLINHDTNKDFWDIVVAFVAKDKNELTKADVKFLESKSLERANSIRRYILENSVEPIINTLPEYRIASMTEFLQNIDLLMSAIGFPILKENIIEIQSESVIYTTNSR